MYRHASESHHQHSVPCKLTDVRTRVYMMLKEPFPPLQQLGGLCYVYMFVFIKDGPKLHCILPPHRSDDGPREKVLQWVPIQPGNPLSVGESASTRHPLSLPALALQSVNSDLLTITSHVISLLQPLASAALQVQFKPQAICCCNLPFSSPSSFSSSLQSSMVNSRFVLWCALYRDFVVCFFFLVHSSQGGTKVFDYPKYVWSPSGGWWCNPRRWKRNTVYAFIIGGGLSVVVAYISAQLEVGACAERVLSICLAKESEVISIKSLHG